MASFNEAIEVIWEHEVAPGKDPLRGWVDHPADPGGETNWGISSLMIAREKMTPHDLGLPPSTPMPYFDSNKKLVVPQPGYLKAMPAWAARMIYEKIYWTPYQFDKIASQTIATKICDCGVNCGQARAIAMAQRAATKCSQPCKDDGLMGPKTIAAINACDEVAFLRAYGAEMQARYDMLVTKNPSLKVFHKNWSRRARWGVP